MTMAHTRNKFTRKTIAIAVAAGMSLGAVTVPQVAGVNGIAAVADAQEADFTTGSNGEMIYAPEEVVKNEMVYQPSAGKAIEYDMTKYLKTLDQYGMKKEIYLSDSDTPIPLNASGDPVSRESENGTFTYYPDTKILKFTADTYDGSAFASISNEYASSSNGGLGMVVFAIGDPGSVSYSLTMRWTDDSHIQAISPNVETKYTNLRVPNNSDKNYPVQPLFSSEFMPDGATLGEITHWDKETLTLITADKDTERAADYSDTLTVPGEGTWKLTVVDGVNPNDVVKATFTPEPSFEGTPTPVQYIMYDEAYTGSAFPILRAHIASQGGPFPKEFGEAVLRNVFNGPYTLYFDEIVGPGKPLPTPTPVDPKTSASHVYQPEYKQISVEQGQTGTVAIPGGTYPTKSTKFSKADNTPAWATVNADGSITVTPGKSVEPKIHQVPVLVTYSDGSTETVNAPVNVTKTTMDLHVTDVTKDDNGNYVVTRNDGEKWTINLKDIRDKIAALEAKKTVSPEDLNKVQDELDKAKKDIADLKGKDAETDKAIQGLRDDLNNLKPRVDKLETKVAKLEGSVIKEVRDNKDGTYTLIRQDNTEVKGTIDTGDNITGIKDNGDGSITITHVDGTTEKVNLSQTTVTETNKGKPNHTITITLPNGKKVSFNAFDTYVTEVKKNAKGDYEIFRSDVGNGKTVWKTIVLSDIRGKVSNLEKNLSELTEKQAADVRNLKKEIDGLETEIEALQGAQEDLEGRVDKLETSLKALTLRVTSLEGRVDNLEDTDNAWAKCYAGIGASGVPMLIALPLALMSDLNIPGLNQLNTQIQRTIGIYNPEAAKWMADNRGMFSAATGVLTAAGVLGMLIHTAKECQPYNKTEGVQDNMNPIIEGSSKLADQIESGSSKADDKDKDSGSSVDAGSSTGESTDNGSSTEAGSSTDKDK